mgnify:CR=1 FL=1
MIYNFLVKTIEEKGAAHIVLIDPDIKDASSIQNRVENANATGVDALFVGGSLMMDSKCSERAKKIKEISEIPVILFPGGIGQVNEYYDAMLFMSFISGRNPQYLIGDQVLAAPIVKDMQLETIPTGYILMDGGTKSMVECISDTRPIPMERIDLVSAHALAGQYLGMKLIYLEAGSGANIPVHESVINSVKNAIDIPIIVGGGIKTPELARLAVDSGAEIVVTGTIMEDDSNCMREFVDAIHIKL